MIFVLIILSGLVLAALISVIVCSVSVKTSEYSVEMPGLSSDIKLVCISDLHGRRYGRDNGRLISLAAAQKPDAILIAGDMITRGASEKQVGRVLGLIKSLCGICRVYFAEGNHESDYMEKNGRELSERIAAAGAFVLSDSFTEAVFGDARLRIGAASGRYFDGSESDLPTLRMLENIGKQGIPSVVMVHQPEKILRCDDRIKWTADLYLSGHTHGGIWGIPGIGGVMAPSQGLFPKYDKGRFSVDGGIDLIINAGLSGYYFIPRMFNRPEICVIKLICQKKGSR